MQPAVGEGRVVRSASVTLICPSCRYCQSRMLAKAIDYMLKRYPAFGRFLDDGRICLNNNATERAFRNGRDAPNAATDTAEGEGCGNG